MHLVFWKALFTQSLSWKGMNIYWKFLFLPIISNTTFSQWKKAFVTNIIYRLVMLKSVFQRDYLKNISLLLDNVQSAGELEFSRCWNNCALRINWNSWNGVNKGKPCHWRKIQWETQQIWQKCHLLDQTKRKKYFLKR